MTTFSNNIRVIEWRVPMLKLMGILAHPDDETLALGGTFAHYAAQGIKTSLIVATRGERGWFDRMNAHPGEEALGSIREKELRGAAHALGITSLAFLDYIDGTLDQADANQAIAKIVRLLRQMRPDVVVTFGPEGLYGHPDHIAISQFTTAALVRAADPSYAPNCELPPHCVSKLYYRTATRAWLDIYMPIFGELRIRIDGQERYALSWTNWSITTRLDTSASWRQVWQAVRCHRTQIPAPERLEHITEDEHRKLWGPQEYYRAFSLVNSGRQEEHDLFEGLYEQPGHTPRSRLDAYYSPVSLIAQTGR